ncbi:MAG TPA: MarR family transcriptional regulator [Terriglobales bacterium]|nr:MarR family transcriptional regulator [Terriglobales bacterium]
MSTRRVRQRARAKPRRKQLIDDILMAGRESSAAAVMFHSVIAERAGLAATDTKTIDTLLRLGPMTAGDLAHHTGLATASVTSLIDRLEKKGLVRRNRDTKDRRRVMVEPILERITAGFAFFGSVRAAYAKLLDDYSDDQLDTILDFMRRSSQRTREMTAEITANPTAATVNICRRAGD